MMCELSGNHLQTDEDVERILRLAVRQTGSDTSLTLRERLLSSAQELGISEEALARAEKQYRIERDREHEFELYKKQARTGFFAHLIPYVIVNTMLMFMSIGDHESWWIYPVCGWGIGLAFHAIGAFNTKSAAFQSEFEAWRAKRRYEREQLALDDTAESYR